MIQQALDLAQFGIGEVNQFIAVFFVTLVGILFGAADRQDDLTANRNLAPLFGILFDDLAFPISIRKSL